MSDDIKVLAKRLRERPFRHASESDLEAIERRQSERVKAADALEEMASARAECERQYQEKVQEVITQMSRAEAAEAERDHLAGEGATLAEKNEALAEDLARFRREVTIAVSDRDVAVAERDRLKAALERVQFMSQTAHNERLAAINATATAALGGDAS